jgi:hypothetical protein
VKRYCVGAKGGSGALGFQLFDLASTMRRMPQTMDE